MPVNCYEFQLCRASESCNCKQKSIQRVSLYTEDWLRRCIRNPLVIGALRGVITERGTRVSDNASLIKLIASQIASGQLRVCQHQDSDSGNNGAAGSASSQGDAPSSKPFPFTPRPKQTSSPALSNDNEPQSLPDNLDGAAQAAALNAAAAQGAPFCPE